MVDKLSVFITRHPKTIIIVAILLLIPSAVGFFSTGINYDLLSYLPTELESVEALDILDKNFQFAASSFLIVSDSDVRNTAKLKEKIEKVDGVAQVLWTNSLIDEMIPADILPDIANSVFYSADGKSTMMIIQYVSGISLEDTLNAVDDIQKIADKNCHLSGLSAVTSDVREICEDEAPLYIAVAILLALLALEFTLNAVVLPLIVLLVLGCAVVYNMGSNIIFGEISFITECIGAVLQLGVTLDYSVFLIDRFNEESQKTDDRELAMSRAISQSFISLVSSSLTTVFGFIALCFMSFSLGFDLGMVMAKGVLFGIITVMTLLPSIILAFYNRIYKHTHKSYIPNFGRLNKFTVKHRKVLAVIFILLVIPSYIAASNIGLYYNVIESMPADLESIASLQLMKDQFNMATTHFVLIDSDLPQKDIEKMQQRIESLDGITYALSLYSFIGSAINTDILPDSILDICEKDGYGLMLINTSYDAGTEEENLQIGYIEDIIDDYPGDSLLTGEGVLTRDLIEVTDVDFMVTNIISVIAIFILIAISFKSISIPVILVAAIELAIFINEGICLLTGARVPFVGPTVIGCVQLGATVDYAILLTERFRQEISKGVERHKAIETASNSSMKSIFQSALVFFVATIGVYFVCDIDLVKSICLLLARGAVISFFVIMMFLSPVLCIANGFIEKTTIGWRKKTASIDSDDNSENENKEKSFNEQRAAQYNDVSNYPSTAENKRSSEYTGAYRPPQSPSLYDEPQTISNVRPPERRTRRDNVANGENNPLLRQDIATGAYRPPEERLPGAYRQNVNPAKPSADSGSNRKLSKTEREERLSGAYFKKEDDE